MRAKFLLVLVLLPFFIGSSFGQSKRDYQWIIGYDTSLLDVNGVIISMDFNFCPLSPVHISTIDNFWMEGSNTSMSNEEGNLLFYSNGCCIVNATGEIMENGDNINPGLIQDVWCPYGGSPIEQGAISIPAPGSDSLYYLFNLDYDQPYFQTSYYGLAPERLYYQVIDMSQEDGLGKVIAKNQVAVQDTFSRGTVKAVRHANGEDWWVVTQKSHSNCYFLTQVTAQGVYSPLLECEGKVWDDDDSGTQAVFTPDAKKYIRFNPANGLNIFDFDNETGDLSNPIVIEFPNDTFYYGGAAVSANSRFLYISARTKLYQFDLQANDIAASKVLIGVWDGFADPYPTIFSYSALAPDNKIYISGTSSHKYLHVIHSPDSLGLMCEFEQRGVELPSYNFATIPNFPQYRSQPVMIDCDSLSNTTSQINTFQPLKIFPNPTTGTFFVQLKEHYDNLNLKVYDMYGRQRYSVPFYSGEAIDIVKLEEGVYLFRIFSDAVIITQGKIIKK